MGANELFDLLIRWFHVIAGILWIGNSMLFNWLDRNLMKKEGIDGEIWLLHSGAFYQVEKKLLKPGEMPRELHWFMWQNFSTWASGIFLLVVVYYLSGSGWLVDPGAGHASYSQALSAGLGTLIGGWVVYDVSCRTIVADRPRLAGVIFLGLLVFVSWALYQVMTPRAAFIHVGVLMGTLMTGNVWTVIIPSQRDLVRATKEGREQSRELSLKAKQRSIHNNYMTYPLIFIMVSNHFPSIYSHRLGWMALLALSIGGALVRHFMNIRWTFREWLPAAFGSAAVAIGAVFLILSQPASAIDQDSLAEGPVVGFSEVQAVVSLRCVPCHSQAPSDDQFKSAPGGISFDTPEQIVSSAKRIRVRVQTGTMPFANKTHMTEDERTLVARWVAQGADVTAVADSEAADAGAEGAADEGPPPDAASR